MCSEREKEYYCAPLVCVPVIGALTVWRYNTPKKKPKTPGANPLGRMTSFAMQRGMGTHPARGAAKGTRCMHTTVSPTCASLQKHVSLLALLRS